MDNVEVFWWISPAVSEFYVSSNGLVGYNVCVPPVLTDIAKLFYKDVIPIPITTFWTF